MALRIGLAWAYVAAAFAACYLAKTAVQTWTIANAIHA